MADKIAKVHTHVSNRAKKIKTGSELEKKSVQKSALDNPFRVDWPRVPMNVQNACFTQINTSLAGLSEWRQSSMKARKRKRSRATMDGNWANDASAVGGELSQTEEIPPSVPNFQHMSIGINAVTKRLETQIAASRRVQESDDRCPPLRLIFVCRQDVDPPLLVNHLPHLVAAANTLDIRMPKKSAELIKLISLPKNSELQLSTVVGVRRLAVFAFDAGAPVLAHLLSLVESVPILTAPWLNATLTSVELLPLHVKQLRTTAPKDIKAAKEKRAKGRAEAKERKRIRISSGND